MIALIAKIAILLCGLGIMAHQLWLHLRVARNGEILQHPKTWQQRLGFWAIALASLAIVFLIYDLGSLTITGWIPDSIRIFGLFCFASGFFFRVWAIRSLGGMLNPDLRITDQERLITHGAYAFARHPFYLSALLFLIGAGFALINVVLLGCIIPLWLIIRQRMRLEEDMLLSYFGESYKQYQQSVPRLLPGLK